MECQDDLFATIERTTKPSAEAEYRRQFSQEPQPLVTLQCNDPEDMALLGVLLDGCGPGQTKAAIAAQAEANAVKVRALQDHLAACEREAVS